MTDHDCSEGLELIDTTSAIYISNATFEWSGNEKRPAKPVRQDNWCKSHYISQILLKYYFLILINSLSYYMRSGATNQAIGQVSLLVPLPQVWLSLQQGDSRPSGSSIIRSCANCPCLGLFPFVATFQILHDSYYYSRVCPYLLLRPCCSHARSMLCGIHTPCMGSPFPAVHARWSRVFRGETV